MTMARPPCVNHERMMSKWISRECNLADPLSRAFTQVGHTDFGDLLARARAGGLSGAVTFTVSLCGRYLFATHGQVAYLYELNHVCPPGRSAWSIPLRRRQGMPLGFLRPVTTIICPRRIISCSMDTSAGRYAAAFLMEGRIGMVCDLGRERQMAQKPPPPAPSGEGSASKSSRPCVCHERSPNFPPRVESSRRSIYRNVCHPDDPPRSVAICPQRNCVAFGCAAGIELHWVDALAGQDLSRWFPLSSPSDFLYFLPARRGLDSAKKLRLISSAAGLSDPFDSIGDILHGFGTTLLGSGSTAVVSLLSTTAGRRSAAVLPEWVQPRRAAEAASTVDSGADYGRSISAGSADHFRAVPLSDGHHILFTDPRTGSLCLGTDAPVGSLTRLLRKVWFRPPAEAASSAPILYVAGADTRHRVRVAATFSARDAGETAETQSNRQIVVFYTLPPDLFHDMSPAAAVSPTLTDQAPKAGGRRGWSESWRADEGYRAIDIFREPFHNSAAYPIEIAGQPLATCSRLTELALDSSPEMIVWAFSADGWAKTWALETTGNSEPHTRTAVQRDGSVRPVDGDGDVAMADGVGAGEAWWDASYGRLQPYDGAAGNTPPETEPPSSSADGYFGRADGRTRDRMSGTVSVDLVEEVNGIVRLDIELR
ncbi:hypothetical protein CDD83_8526 [Cordyceps sp. RAO-2017]|nr:hypothetical protein CDD83_8526 [Cordyceps sp. RAO-2017]